jgi:chromosome segregation ATPase
MILRLPANVTLALLLAGVVAFAADPSDFFLKAYQDYQAGEKLERDGRLRDAINSYASTVAILEQIRKDDPSWQEIVVNFRMRKAQQNIERLRAMVVNEPENLPSQRDQLPTRGFDIDIPEPAVMTRPNQKSTAKNPQTETDISSEQIASLERQLAEYRKLHSEEKTRRERLEGEFSSVKMELEKTRTELVAVNSRLAQSEDARQNLSAERDQLKSKAGEPQDQKIEKLSSRIARLEAEKEVAQDENARLLGKLEKAASYIAESNKVLAATDADRRNVAAQRDKALGRINRLKDNDAELEALKQENAKLQKQLVAGKTDADRLTQDRIGKQDPLGKTRRRGEKALGSVKPRRHFRIRSQRSPGGDHSAQRPPRSIPTGSRNPRRQRENDHDTTRRGHGRVGETGA